jgi:chromosome segregation ATPase
LEQAGRAERIDHRSHAQRGLDEQPTVHEGVEAHALERRGIRSERCELNRQIKADNALLRELKATAKKLTQAVKDTIPDITTAMENVRRNVIIFCYQLGHIRTGQKKTRDYLSSVKTEFNRYNALADKIKATYKERKSLLAGQKKLPFWNVPKKKELTARIAGLTELLDELRSEKAIMLQRLQCADESGISSLKTKIADTEAGLQKLEEQEQKYASELDEALKQYADLQAQAAEFDLTALDDARQALRPDTEQSAVQRIQQAYGEKYSHSLMQESKREVSRLLSEDTEQPRSIRERLRQAEEKKQAREQQTKKKSRDSWER